MKLSFHVTFKDGSNPYYSFPKEANEAIKAANQMHNKYLNSRIDIYIQNTKYRITNTAWGRWAVYLRGIYCDIYLKEYTWLANAVKFLEKRIEKENQK